ncbi:hypothetical protein HYH03_005386 [Edaphochlamys debaryana]|uniref:Nudix hydrolase domain-containing protein n=1 Tax=Edaphochlamys debaryana TaxID=47281 RepID=A0A835YFB7_9CHLO|nr:hypothetical protein HYH03_005386 [Edaphochlamys debaryana]|eukprot:KAG2496564.1 hypothetical protein HYH03_005386 [Edaphochlamys debaryana]
MATGEAPSKVGAGLLICCEGACLVLKRSEASGNPGSWGLPGGNADPEDAGDLLKTALREAGEEIGALPEGLQVRGSILTRRGKALQKRYTIFICTIPPPSRAAYQPTLNDEHTDWRWLDVNHAWALARPHAVAHEPGAHDKPLMGASAQEEAAAAAAAAAGPPPSDMALHPVVRILFGGANVAELQSMLPPPGAGGSTGGAA